MAKKKLPEVTLRWVKTPGLVDGYLGAKLEQHDLVLTIDGHPRVVANVWSNGIWHTWDHRGAGGENSSEKTVRRAKIEAAAAVIDQGFI